MLASQCELVKLDAPTREYRFHPDRKWRIDLCWIDRRLALEVEGEVHRISDKFKRDLEKYQALFFAGFRLLRVSPAQVKNGTALRMVERALETLPFQAI